VVSVTRPAVIGELSSDWETIIPVKNDSSRTWSIRRIEQSCSCLETEVPKMGLGPGEAMNLRIRADLRARRGKQFFVATLFGDEGPILTARVEVEVLERVRVSLDGDSSQQLPEMEPLQSKTGILRVDAFGTQEQDVPTLGELTVSGAEWVLLRTSEEVKRINSTLWCLVSCKHRRSWWEKRSVGRNLERDAEIAPGRSLP
jgi:hypothetical protein